MQLTELTKTSICMRRLWGETATYGALHVTWIIYRRTRDKQIETIEKRRQTAFREDSAFASHATVGSLSFDNSSEE